MIFLYVATALAVLMLSAWAIMIMPAPKHRLTAKIKSYIYAHRGLHDISKNIPENSMAAFRRAVTRGYGIELDLHLSASGSPVVIHDTSLKRTADADIDITAIPDSDIKSHPLEGTNERIPFFTEVLREVAGRVPLLIELKVDKNNFASLCDAVLKELKDYAGVYAIQSFDPRAVRYLKNHHPQVMRGQLSGFLRKSGDKLHSFLDFGLRNLLTNFLTRPHFIAYRVQDTGALSVSLCRQLYHPLEFNWTIRKKKQFKRAKSNGAIPIFEDYIP